MFYGTTTAITTPFTREGKIDYESFRSHLHLQLEAKIDSILIAGCTGESFTLEPDEKIEMLKFAKEVCKDKTKIILGTGNSSTERAISLTRRAKSEGADGVLVITPYGNKPSQKALIEYFTQIAQVGIPVILYNVPSRTGCNISPETVIHLSYIDNIVAIKEAGGNLDNVSRVISECDITVLSGDDSLTLPMLSLGAKGVISTVSNILPKEMKAIVDYALEGEFAKSRKVHLSIFKLMKALFVEPNPTPLKYVLYKMGIIRPYFRKPLIEINPDSRTMLDKILKEMELI